MQNIKPVVLSVFSAVLLGACAQQSNVNSEVDKDVVAMSYECDSGAIINASYPDFDSAVIKYMDTTYALNIAKSADGARYVGAGFEWWTKGSGLGAQGTLFKHNKDGTSGERLEFCVVK